MISFLAAFLPPVFFLVLWVLIIRKRGLEFRYLVQSGIETLAAVVKKLRLRSGGRRTALVYEFADPKGAAHRRRVFVTREVYDSVQEGSPVAVMYLAKKPSVNALKSDVEQARKALVRPRGGP